MLTNPVAPFYEWFLSFYILLPDAFKAFLGLVYGLTIFFAILNIFVRVMR